MPNVDLEKRLKELRLQGDKTFAAYKSSRDLLYHTICSAYMFWRQCDQQNASFLPTQYEEQEIRLQNRQDNRVNFSPFIQLIFGIRRDNSKDSNKITHWNAVFRALHDAYEATPENYKTNPVTKLINLIVRKKGITEIYKQDDTPATDDGEDGYSPKKPTKKDLAEIARILGKRKVTELKEGKYPPLMTITDGGADLAANEDGFVALVGRIGDDGILQIMAHTADAETINAVAFKSLRSYAQVIDPALRIIAETIHTQTFPQRGKPLDREMERIWRSVVETGDTKITKLVDKKDKTGKLIKQKVALTNPRRLILLDGGREIIYSKLREPTSVVTILKPTTRLAGNEPLFMKTEERRAIEEPILDGSLPVFRANPPDRLATVVRDKKTIYELELFDDETRKRRTLHFYKREAKPGQSQSNFQPTFDADSKYKATWRFEADKAWFLRLRSEWLDQWFESLGSDKRILRSDSRLFELKVMRERLFIRFEIDHKQHGDKHEAKIFHAKLTGEPLQSCLVMSLDLAPVLYNLSEIDYDGMVTVSGNGNAIVFDYQTAAGAFRIAMPTVMQVKKAWNRSAVHFSRANF